MATTIDSLPCEVLINIFNCLDSFVEMLVCSHVNKRWRELCPSVMCSRNLTIETEQEATLFYWFLDVNEDKRRLIKHITVINTGEEFEGTERMLDLLTNSLETLDGKAYSAMFYIMFPNPEVVGTVFSKLKTIPDASGYHNIYNKLLYNLRHSLEKIEMGFPDNFDTSYSNTEAIIKNCDALHDLTIYLRPSNGTGVSGDFDTWLREHVRQIYSLKTLKIIIRQDCYPSLTKYLFHKYPNVETVIFEQLFTNYNWTTNNILGILQDIKAKPRFILECGVDYFKIDKSFGALLQVKSDPAMVNEIPSLIKRPAPLRVRYPTREEILAAQDSDYSSFEDSSGDSFGDYEIWTTVR
ncbi:hypothetical protein V8B55DRAFT_1595698 [Mucor lusitanicus]